MGCKESGSLEPVEHEATRYNEARMSLTVPFLDLQAQYRPLRDDILAAITRVSDSQRFIMGPEIAGLETELAGMLEVEHAVAVSSGTDALLLALMTLGVGPGDEVVTSSYSFFATAAAVVRLGARPVLVDIEPATFNLDPEQVASAITPRTRAIIPVHLFGLSADLGPILDLAARSNVPVVEDAAQAIGSAYGARQVGGLGALGCFSFFPTKNLGAFGDAGLLTTNDAALAARARLLREHGMAPRFYHHIVGANFRMDEIQAAVLRVKAPHLSAWIQARRANASRYVRMFRDRGLLDRVAVPVEPAGRRHTFNQFVVRTASRDALKRHLDGRGIGNAIYYPVPFHLQPCFAGLGYGRGAFPNAERAANEALALPIYGELSVDQQQSVVDGIAGFFADVDARGDAPRADLEKKVPV
jgi:dTDP-4-amino-4,6-dideoxygalactose transaminase